MPQKVSWYKTDIPRETLRFLTTRSDLKGLAQTLGHLLLLVVSGTLSIILIRRELLLWSIVSVMAHGVFWSFLLNGFHELSHNTVFKSKKLNMFFLRLFSLLSWNNYVFFQASHRAHHAHTLHPPDDLEVLLPIKLTIRDFLTRAIVNPIGMIETIFGTFQLSLGQVRGNMPTGFGKTNDGWLTALFPEDKPEERRRLIQWAQITLAFHIVITAVSITLGYWPIALLVSAAPFYGSWLLYFLNHTQHIGLKDNVSDFRLNSRTIILGSFLRFLYWSMNFHIEHHMYAAVPCYNLKHLHRVVRHDTPRPTRGLIRTWIQIGWILNQQRRNPEYQYNAPIPTNTTDISHQTT